MVNNLLWWLIWLQTICLKIHFTVNLNEQSILYRYPGFIIFLLRIEANNTRDFAISRQLFFLRRKFINLARFYFQAFHFPNKPAFFTCFPTEYSVWPETFLRSLHYELQLRKPVWLFVTIELLLSRKQIEIMDKAEFVPFSSRYSYIFSKHQVVQCVKLSKRITGCEIFLALMFSRDCISFCSLDDDNEYNNRLPSQFW